MSTLRQLKLRITDHFLNEANLMKDIISSGLNSKEIDELQHFLNNNPYSKLIDDIQASVKRS